MCENNILIVVTTKDIPIPNEKGFTLLEAEKSKKLDGVLSKMLSSQGRSISDYLATYQHPDLKEEVADYLRKNETIPVLWRQVGQYWIYVAPCLDSSISGGATKQSHDYVAKLIDIAKNHMSSLDIKIKNNNAYAVVHDVDLTFRKDKHGNNRVFESGEDGECHGELASMPNGHIYIFQHSDQVKMYSEFVELLSEKDSVLEGGCRIAIKMK